MKTALNLLNELLDDAFIANSDAKTRSPFTTKVLNTLADALAEINRDAKRYEEYESANASPAIYKTLVAKMTKEIKSNSKVKSISAIVFPCNLEDIVEYNGKRGQVIGFTYCLNPSGKRPKTMNSVLAVCDDGSQISIPAEAFNDGKDGEASSAIIVRDEKIF